MPRIKRIAKAYLFDNGTIACFDNRGNQIPEVQGAYSIDLHKRIILEASDSCEYQGFSILPIGFQNTVQSWANYFCKQDLSWSEIKEI